jgi:large repetitive protein
MEFQTNVPMPVVTVDVPDTMPYLEVNEEFAFMATLTNHGLITAKDVMLNLQQDHPLYEFVTNYVPADLLALQSIQVPVLMRRRTVPLEGFAGTSVSGVSAFLGMREDEFRDAEEVPIGCKGFAGVMYWYYCSLTTGLWTVGGELYHYQNIVCPPVEVEFEYNPGSTAATPPNCPFCPPPPIGVSLGGNGLPLTTEKKTCVECILDVVGAMANCFKLEKVEEAVDAIGEFMDAYEDASCFMEASTLDEVNICAIDIIVAKLEGIQDDLVDYVLEETGISDVQDQISEAIDEIPGIGCVTSLIGAASTCANTDVASAQFAGFNRSRSGPSSVFDQIVDNLSAYLSAVIAFENRAKHYYGDLVTREHWPDLVVQLQPNIQAHTAFSPAQQSSILASMAGTDVSAAELNAFFNRWNTTMTANAAGVFSPTTAFPDIIDTLVVSAYMDTVGMSLDYAAENNFGSLIEMYLETVLLAYEAVDINSNSVCASVTVQLSQTVTMTREAFRGTLDIFNGHPTDALDSLSVDIVITDPDGVPSNGLFQINTEQLTNLSDVTGTGMIAAQENGIVQFLFIPEIGAAPTVPVAVLRSAVR